MSARALRQAARIRAHLELRVAQALEWYSCPRGEARALPETLENVRQVLASIVEEVARKFGLRGGFPFVLKARFEGDEIVVETVDRALS